MEPGGISDDPAHLEAVLRVLGLMRARWTRSWSLDEMGEIAGFHAAYFARVFRRVTGVPPGAFGAALRIQAAQRLLVDERLRVTDVCYELGYASLGTFSRRFTAAVGLSPRGFRRLARRDVLADVEIMLAGSPVAVPYLPMPMRGIRGRVITPAEFEGLVVAGLFPGRIPGNLPVGGTVVAGAPVYCLPRVPNGVFHLAAIGFPAAASRRDYLLPEADVLVGEAGGPVVIGRGSEQAKLELVLRAPRPTDPPLLSPIPLILAHYLAGSAFRRRGDAG